MKKLFTLVAFLAICFGAQAKVVEDAYIDFSTWTEFTNWASDAANERMSFEDGALKISNPEATENFWDIQYIVVGGLQFEEDATYTVTINMKGSVAGTMRTVKLGGWSGGPATSVDIPAGDYQDVVVQLSGVDQGDFLMLQHGDYVGDLWIKSIRITHEEIESANPEVWNELLVNGDAEGAYGDVPCAYSKEFNRYQRDDGMPENEPYPCDIEDDGTGNKVFVVHAKQVNKDDFAEEGQYNAYPGGGATGAYEWMNQFWLQSPKSWKKGEQVAISFRYKADKAVTANTQCHGETPGSYLHWAAIGDINFTEDWQTFEKKFTIPDEGDGMWSIAFNLKEVDTDVTYYFDDLSWQEMELEEGIFIVGANPAEGLAYDYSKSVSMEWNDEEEAYFATVGTKDEYVSEVTISTKRGNDKAFMANTLGLEKSTLILDEWDGNDVKAKAKSVIKFPGQGIWNVGYDAEYQLLYVHLVEGKLNEVVEIKANPTEIVVEGVERDWKAEGEEGVGVGQPWDNQFWILANRPLKAGEETYIEFEYMSSVEAKTTTQCHGDIANGGNYMHWQAIGDVNFTTEWQTATINFTVPAAADGMQSIAFNMAEIKDACDYHIKNVIWCLGSKEESYESLINMDGNDNFWLKISAGTAPYQFGHKPEQATSGDINGDGTVDIADLNLIIDNMSGISISGDADVNGDGTVDIADLNIVIDIMSGE